VTGDYNRLFVLLCLYTKNIEYDSSNADDLFCLDDLELANKGIVFNIQTPKIHFARI